MLPPGMRIAPGRDGNEEPVVRFDAAGDNGVKVSVVLPPAKMRLVAIELLRWCDIAESGR